MITHIVAMDRNRAIGRDNELPWHLPEDLQHFKEITMDKTIVMGSNTFRSIVKYANGRPLLPGRDIIVISASPGNVTRLFDEIGQPTNVKYWTKPVLDFYIKANLTSDIFIVGGAKLYGTYRPDRILATIVDLKVEDADTFYPWDIQEYALDNVKKSESRTGLSYSINTYIT